MTTPAPTFAHLTLPRAQAIRMLRTHLEKGLLIKRSRIRYVNDLEQARTAKGEWTSAVMDMLKRMFDSDAVADECQNWVGKVLPEYADLDLFIEHFYDEMDQRLRKLHAVLARVQELPAEPAQTVRAAAEPQRPAAAAPSPAPVAPPMTRPSGVLLSLDEAASPVVQAFVGRLGFELAVLAPDRPLDQTWLAPSPPSFGLVVQTASRRASEFDLGYLCGRLGADRLCILDADGDHVFSDERQLPHLPLDAAEGWQLHLARRLKKTGLDVDLNRVA